MKVFLKCLYFLWDNFTMSRVIHGGLYRPVLSLVKTCYILISFMKPSQRSKDTLADLSWSTSDHRAMGSKLFDEKCQVSRTLGPSSHSGRAWEEKCRARDSTPCGWSCCDQFLLSIQMQLLGCLHCKKEIVK